MANAAPMRRSLHVIEMMKGLGPDPSEEVDQLIWQMRNAVRKNPLSLDDRVALAMLLLHVGDRSEGIDQIDIAYGLRGTGDVIHIVNLASLLVGVGEMERAVQLAHDALDHEKLRTFRETIRTCGSVALYAGNDALLERCASAEVALDHEIAPLSAGPMLRILGAARLIPHLEPIMRSTWEVARDTTCFLSTMLDQESGLDPIIVLEFWTNSPFEEREDRRRQIDTRLRDMAAAAPDADLSVLSIMLMEIRSQRSQAA